MWKRRISFPKNCLRVDTNNQVMATRSLPILASMTQTLSDGEAAVRERERESEGHGLCLWFV